MKNRIARFSDTDREEMQSAFLEHIDRLLLPAYLLAGSHEQAAECFLEAWNACNEQTPPIAGYGVTVAKRAVIKAAILKIAPGLAEIATRADPSARALAASERHGRKPNMNLLNDEAFLQAILALNVLHRAVLVLRLYEGFSATDVALLLGISRRTFEYEWQQALIELINATEMSTSAGHTTLQFNVPVALAEESSATPRNFSSH